jgi:hypothetical protein
VPPDGSADARRTRGRIVSRRFEPLDLQAEVDPNIGPCSQNGERMFMKNQVSAGAILVEEGTLVPDSFTLDSELYSSGWGSLKNPDRGELGRELHGAGWTFFFLADEIKRSVVGFDEQEAIRTAVKRLLSSVKTRCLNCLEVRRVVTKTFLGLHFVSVFAHPRHIQKSSALAALSAR